MTSDTFAMGVTFLTGRFHGREWPPSPARLYQALIAGVMTGGYRELFAEVAPALRWLEQQRAPSISVAPHRESVPYRIAVPNNDLDRAGLAWAGGREANAAEYRTLKAIEPREISSDGPNVVYRWRADPQDIAAWSSALQKAAHCLHTFGWGVDMAFADVVSEVTRMPEIRYSPADDGTIRLDVPAAGTLGDLQSTYQRFIARTSGGGIDTHTHPSVIDNQRYRQEGALESPVVRFRLFEPDLENIKSIPWAHCMKVAGWLRHETAAALREAGWPEEEIASYVQGHTSGDEKSNRISYVPLPNISVPYPDGRIRRVMIVEPAIAPGRAVRALERAMPGRFLTDEKGSRTACLSPAAEGEDWVFDQYANRRRRWRVWRSVTPVLLHGFNVHRRGVIDVHKTEKLLLRAFEMAGHSAACIDRLSFQAGPLWRGGGHSSAMLVPQHLIRYPRLHVQVAFKSAIAGPVLAGLGRHYGIGIFAGAER